MKKLLLSLLFIPVLGYGADPCPDCRVEIFLDDVSGGLSTSLPDYKLTPQFSPYMRNVIIDEGKVELPGGFDEIGSTNTLMAPTGIFVHVQDNGSVNYIVTDSSVALYTQDFQFYTFISSGLNTGVLLRCKQIRSNMWCSNGADTVFSWDGETRTDLDGNNGTPDVPKGKYIEYYQERVFLFNLSNNNSQAAFSDFRSTNGVQISPENFLAWPALNRVNVGQGDGEVGTAIWIENGQLQFGKERSIYTLFGNSGSNYNPIKTSPDIGVASHDTVVLMDGQANFLGPDGFYVGRQRISDHIETEVNSINKDSQDVIENSWDSQSEFGEGNFYGSTATPTGFVVQISTTYGIPPAGLRPDNRTITPDGVLDALDANEDLDAGTTFYGFAQLQFNASQLPSYSRTYVSKIFWANTELGSDPCGIKFASVTVMNMATGQEKKTVVTSFAGAGDSLLTANFDTDSNPLVLFDGYDVLASTLSVKVEGCKITLIQPSVGLRLELKNSTTFQYVSEITTNTNVTAWSKFDSDNILNGGSIEYYIRTGTDPVHVSNSTRTWTPQAAGTNISAPVGEGYIQWAATMTTISTTPATGTQIDNVTISHIEGSGASNRSFAAKWKNRYWVFTSTENSNLSLGFIRAKNTSPVPNAFMPIEGINIRSLVSDGETLFAGSSSTGVFYRLDFGTNYNGSPIQAVYDTPAKFMGSLFTEKELFEYYYVDDLGMDKEITLGVSADGSDYKTDTIDLEGSGTIVKTITKVRPPRTKGKLFRFRFDFNQLDKSLSLKNFGVLYRDIGVRRGINE